MAGTAARSSVASWGGALAEHEDEEEHSEDGSDQAESVDYDEQHFLEDAQVALQESPIRTRFVPKAERRKDLAAFKGFERGVCYVNARAREGELNPGEKRKTTYSVTGGYERIYATEDKERLERMGRQMKKNAGAMTKASKRLYKNARREANVIYGTARQVATTTITESGGAGADRCTGELVSLMNELPKDLPLLRQYGITGAQYFLEHRKQDLEDLKGVVHVVNPEHSFTEQMRQGKFFCCANLGPNGKLISHGEMETEDPHSHHLSRSELMELLKAAQASNGNDEGNSPRLKETIKGSALSAEAAEELVAMSNQVIRHQPQAHEAVFDFADARICMPRYIKGGRAGQLVYTEPSLDDKGENGEVLMKCSAPKRRLNDAPTELAKLGDLTVFEESLHRANAGSPVQQKHAHMHFGRKPPSAETWRMHREIMRRKREAAAKETSLEALRTGKGKDGDKAAEEEEEEELEILDTTELDGHEEEEREAQREATRKQSSRRGQLSGMAVEGATPLSPDSAGSPTSSRRRGGVSGMLTAPGAGAMASPGMASPAGLNGGRAGRRAGVGWGLGGIAAQEVKHWDARPPPNGEELGRMYRKLGVDWELPEGVLETLEASARGAKRKPHRKMSSAVRGVTPDDDASNVVQWSLTAKGAHGSPLEIVFSLDLDGLPPERDTPVRSAAADNLFWKDVLLPAGPPQQRRHGLFAMFGC